jgi:beta-lactamase class A
MLIGALAACAPLARAGAAPSLDEVVAGIAALEQKYGGRLGVAIFDLATMRTIAHRGDERFAMCSTFKFLAVLFVLARVDNGSERLERRIVYDAGQLVPYSPITEKHVGGNGLSVGELCEAAMTLSDNTAANLLLDSFGGPQALTAYLRSIHDLTTRLDRREPELNEAASGDPRDTTTPVAMLAILHWMVFQNTLSPASRQHLIAWLVANKTGDRRLRAGVPQGWRVGDKTGSGGNNTVNDIAVMWPTSRAPIVVTAYYTESRADGDARDKVLAEVGRLAASI